MSKIKIETVDSPAELFNRYPNQDRPQDCFIELDLSSGRMSADSNPEIGNAVPMDVWHGLVRRYSLPGPILGDVANTLMADIASPAQSVLDHAWPEWDGNNNVVRTHERNCADEWSCDCPVAVAERAIEAAINDVGRDDLRWLVCPSWCWAEDWYTYGADEYVARVQALVRAGTDEDDAIRTVSTHMEQEIEDENKSAHAEYWWVVEEIEEYLAEAVAQAKTTEEVRA